MNDITITIGTDLSTGLEYNYDGTSTKSLNEAQYQVSGLVNGDKITNVTITIDSSNAGVYDSDQYVVSYDLVDADGKDASDKYNITLQKLAIEITVRPITISGNSDTKMYDGIALTNGGFTGIGLVEGDYIDSGVTVTGSMTHVGEVANEVSVGSLVVKNRDGEDVTGNYTVNSVANGKLSITARDVTLTSASDSMEYDGTPLTNNTVIVSGSGFVDGEGADYNVTGSQTIVGSSENTFEYTLNGVTSENDYVITQINGYLTVLGANAATVSSRVRATQTIEDGRLAVTRSGSVAINALKSDFAFNDIAGIVSTNNFMAEQLALNGDVIVTDRTTDWWLSGGHDTYGVRFAADDAASASLTTDYAARTTVTRESRSRNGAEVYGIAAGGDLTIDSPKFLNIITVTATNTLKKDGGALSATGLSSGGSIEGGDYAATLRVSALDKTSKASSNATATGIDAAGSVKLEKISKSIYAYANGDGATAAGIDADNGLKVNGDIAGAMTVRALSTSATGSAATATGFASAAGAIEVGGALTKAVQATAQNTNKETGKATATAISAKTDLTIAGGVKAAVKATASSAGDATARGLYARGGDMTLGSLLQQSVTAKATSTLGKARADGINAKGVLEVTDGQLGTVTATAKGVEESDTMAIGISASSIATGGSALTGKINANSSNRAVGIYLTGDQALLKADKLTIKAGDKTTATAYAVDFAKDKKAELEFVNSLIVATGTKNAYAFYSHKDDTAEQSVTLNGTRVTGDVVLRGGNDTLKLANGSGIAGDVNLGTDDDTLELNYSWIKGDVDLGDGKNTAELTGASSITGNVTTGDESDLISLDDAAKIRGDVSTGADNDAIVLDGKSTIGEIDKKYKANKPEQFDTVDMGDGDDTLDIFAGARVTANVYNVEEATFHLSDMNPRTYLWVGTDFDADSIVIDIDATSTDFELGRERTFTVLRDMNGDFLTDYERTYSVTGLGGTFENLKVNGPAVFDNGWWVRLEAYDNNNDGSETLYAVVTQSILFPTHKIALADTLTAVQSVSGKAVIGNNDADFFQFGGSDTLSSEITTLAGNDVISFDGDRTWDVSKKFSMGNGTDTVTTYGYKYDNLTPDTETYAEMMTEHELASGDNYQLGDRNTVTLTGKTFASSAELKSFFDAAGVENYIGQFNVSQDDAHSLTVVEDYDTTQDPLVDSTKADWGTVDYTEFTTAGDALVLAKGEIKDVKGYTSVDFNGDEAGEKVTGTFEGAKTDGTNNVVTSADAVDMAMDAFTGKVTSGSLMGAPTITATAATATFKDYKNVSSLESGTLAYANGGVFKPGFETVDFNGEADGEKVTGVISEVSRIEGAQTVTAYSATKIEGFTGVLTDGAATDAKTITATAATAKAVTAGEDMFQTKEIELTGETGAKLEGLDSLTELHKVQDNKGNSVGTELGGKIVSAEIGSLEVVVTDGNEFLIGGADSIVKSSAQNGLTVSGDYVYAKINADRAVKIWDFSKAATLEKVKSVTFGENDTVTLTGGAAKKLTTSKAADKTAYVGKKGFELAGAAVAGYNVDGALATGDGLAGKFTDASTFVWAQNGEDNFAAGDFKNLEKIVFHESEPGALFETSIVADSVSSVGDLTAGVTTVTTVGLKEVNWTFAGEDDKLSTIKNTAAKGEEITLTNANGIIENTWNDGDKTCTITGTDYVNAKLGIDAKGYQYVKDFTQGTIAVTSKGQIKIASVEFNDDDVVTGKLKGATAANKTAYVGTMRFTVKGAAIAKYDNGEKSVTVKREVKDPTQDQDLVVTATITQAKDGKTKTVLIDNDTTASVTIENVKRVEFEDGSYAQLVADDFDGWTITVSDVGEKTITIDKVGGETFDGIVYSEGVNFESGYVTLTQHNTGSSVSGTVLTVVGPESDTTNPSYADEIIGATKVEFANDIVTYGSVTVNPASTKSQQLQTADYNNEKTLVVGSDFEFTISQDSSSVMVGAAYSVDDREIVGDHKTNAIRATGNGVKGQFANKESITLSSDSAAATLTGAKSVTFIANDKVTLESASDFTTSDAATKTAYINNKNFEIAKAAKVRLSATDGTEVSGDGVKAKIGESQRVTLNDGSAAATITDVKVVAFGTAGDSVTLGEENDITTSAYADKTVNVADDVCFTLGMAAKAKNGNVVVANVNTADIIGVMASINGAAVTLNTGSKAAILTAIDSIEFESKSGDKVVLDTNGNVMTSAVGDKKVIVASGQGFTLGKKAIAECGMISVQNADTTKTVEDGGVKASLDGTDNSVTLKGGTAVLSGVKIVNIDCQSVSASSVSKAEFSGMKAVVSGEFTLSGADITVVDNIASTNVSVKGDGVKATLSGATLDLSTGSAEATVTGVTDVKVDTVSKLTMVGGYLEKASTTGATLADAAYGENFKINATGYGVTNSAGVTAQMTSGSEAVGSFVFARSFNLNSAATVSFSGSSSVNVVKINTNSGVSIRDGYISSVTKGATAEDNSVTASTLDGMAIMDYTGNVTDGTNTVSFEGTNGASAKLTDYQNIASITAGTVVGAFASVDFNGDTAGQKVTGTIHMAGFDGDSQAVALYADDGFTLEGYTGSAYGNDGEIVTAQNGATATFTNAWNVTKLSSGTLNASGAMDGFSSVDFNGDTAGQKVTGTLTSATAGATAAKNSVTATKVTALDGFTGKINGTDGDDVININNDKINTAGTIALGGGEDKLTVDINSVLDVTTIDMGDGEDTFEITGICDLEAVAGAKIISCKVDNCETFKVDGIEVVAGQAKQIAGAETTTDETDDIWVQLYNQNGSVKISWAQTVDGLEVAGNELMNQTDSNPIIGSCVASANGTSFAKMTGPQVIVTID